MAALPAVIVQTCHCPDLSLRGAQRRGNPLKDVSVPGDCFVALLLRMTVPAFPVRLKTLQSRFRSLSLTAAVRGAKVRADLALVRTVPQSDAKNGGIPCSSFRLRAHAAPACPAFCPTY